MQFPSNPVSGQVVTSAAQSYIYQNGGWVSQTVYPAIQPISAATLPLPTDAAKEDGNLATIASNTATANSALSNISSTLSSQKYMTIWTDDTGSYFLLQLAPGGTPVWTNTAGSVLSSGPGAGMRVASGVSAIVDATRYQATAAGTGYSVGDYLSHIVTTDPTSGTVLGFFWLNVSTNLKLAAAPLATTIAPITALPVGASTSANQPAINADGGSLAHVTNWPGVALETGGNLATIATKISGALAVNQTLLTTGYNKISDGTSVVAIKSGTAATSADPALVVTPSPTSYGQKTSANSAPVVIASDQSPLAVSGVTAIGAALTNPPLAVSGLDSGGLKRAILTDATGAVILGPSSNALGSVGISLGTSGGWQPHAIASVSGLYSSPLKSGPGQLGNILAYNPNPSTVFLQLYNVAVSTSVQLGTTPPDYIIAIPAGFNGGFSEPLPGLEFTNGIVIAAATTAAGSGLPSAGITVSYGVF